MPEWPVMAGTLVLGVATGMLSAAFGVGGAVVSTPGIRALGATPLQGVGSTLPSILPSALTGTLRYHREGLVRWGVVRWTAPCGAAMAVVGALASVRVPGHGHVQMILTALLVGYTAARMARTVDDPARSADPGAAPVAGRAVLIGAMAGTLSGFLGIGGGVLMVPAFRNWLRLPLKETVGTSLACVGLLAVPGIVTHQIEGTIDWAFALPLCLGVVPGARLGAHLAVTASERALRLTIGVILGAIAVVYGLAELRALL